MSNPVAPVALYDVFSNSLILLVICPLLPLESILALTMTSKAISELIWATPQVFKRVDLSSRSDLTGPIYNNEAAERASHHLSIYNYFYQLRSKNKLQSISIMILDRLPVPEGLLRWILEGLNVRLLSIRGIKTLDPRTVILSLLSPSHPISKLKGLYYFGPPDDPPIDHATTVSCHSTRDSTGIMSSPGAQLGARASMPGEKSTSLSGNVGWYDGNGTVPLPLLDQYSPWEDVIHACAGIIAFDIITCRHCLMRARERRTVPRLATISLKGCKICGSCPEGPAFVGKSPESHLPLLAPVPLYSSTVRVAQIPPSEALSHVSLIARCHRCLRDRWCLNCNAWWCESCYTPPEKVTNGEGSLQAGSSNGSIKVHLGLCVENCLVAELYSGVGEGGMWG